MDQTVCGYTNWDTFVVGLWADNNEGLWTELWDILKQHGDNPDAAKPLLRDFYQDTVYPIANKGEDNRIDFWVVNWDEIIKENLAQWQAEKHYYEEATE